jgi:glycosyltransferase involved in cell wall biosynthesis
MDLHFARSYLGGRDLPILKKMGKKIIIHCHGCDVRYYEEGMDFPLNACHHCYGTRDSLRKKETLNFLRTYADAFVVTTPDLLKFVPEATYIPTALQIEKLQIAPQRVHEGSVRIFHASSDPIIKGTRYIEEALGPLIEAGKVTLSVVQSRPRGEVLRIAREADIAIDQMFIGWYGLFAQEMMALGKPVICYINKKLASWQPELPIIRADPSSLASVVEQLIKDNKLRREKGLAGRRFVERVHSSQVVAQQLINLYHSL